MSLTLAAGLGGLGFVVAAIAVNVAFTRARLPMPVSGYDLDAVVDSFATVGDGLKRPSVFAPVMWLCTTVFAAGLLAQLWRGGTAAGAWALVGFAGVLMQNVTFACIEALRFAVAAAARHDRGATAALWDMFVVLFAFNQVFLVVALLGFSVAGAGDGFIPAWHAWLGYVSAALLFISSSAGPYAVSGGHRFGPVGLVGWLGWVVWIVVYSVALLRA